MEGLVDTWVWQPLVAISSIAVLLLSGWLAKIEIGHTKLANKLDEVDAKLTETRLNLAGNYPDKHELREALAAIVEPIREDIRRVERTIERTNYHNKD